MRWGFAALNPSYGARQQELVDPRHDLFADQLERAHHEFGGDRGAEIQFEQDAVDAEFPFQFLEPVGDPLRPADDDLVAQDLLVGDRAHFFDFGAPARIGRAFEPRDQRFVAGHDARLAFFESLLVVIADVHREAQVNLAMAGMPGGDIGVAVGPEIRREPRQGAAAHRHEERIAEFSQCRERVLAGAGNADWRVRLLVGSRHGARLVEAVVLALIRERVLGPSLLQNLERFEKALAAFFVGDAIGAVAARVAAAPGAENETAAADDIDRRRLFREAQGVGQRQHVHGRADPDALRARRDLAGDVHRRAQYRAAGLLVDFGKPEHVEAPTVGGFDLLKTLLERVGIALARDLPVKFVVPAELHGDLSNA